VYVFFLKIVFLFFYCSLNSVISELDEDAPDWMVQAAVAAQYDGSAAANAKKRLIAVVNARNSAGMTPLHVACFVSAERCAAALLANMVPS